MTMTSNRQFIPTPSTSCSTRLLLLPCARPTAMRLVQLSNGRTIPAMGMGLGTAWWKRTAELHALPVPALNQDCVEAVKSALGAGFTHLDLAEMYDTDAEVGAALRQLQTPRDKLFVTSKLLASLADVPGATQGMLDKLGLSHFDLLLIHAPFLPEGVQLQQAWRDVEALVDAGKATSIGVSNFRVEDLEQLLSFARIKPVLNQVEFHPYLQQPELHAFCHTHGIAVAGYSGLIPLTHRPGGPVDSVVERIAAARGLTPAQVLQMWALQKGAVVITTTGRRERMAEYLAAEAAAAAAADPQAGGGPLNEEQVRQIDEAGAKLEFRKYWAKEFGFVDEAAAAAAAVAAAAATPPPS